MLRKLLLVAAVCLLFLAGVAGLPDGAWAADAQRVILLGDIDNLGFGFPSDFDVFSGASTPVHSFPFQPEPGDPAGTDRIMVGTSYDGRPPSGYDGYTRTTSRPHNLPQPIEMRYDLGAITVNAAILQIFADDFQSPVWGSRFEARLNNRRAPFMENVLNALVQTGPIGKLISLPVPAEFLSEVASGELIIAIDDPTTGAGDGYAIDFVRLLVNPTLETHLGTIVGRVTDADTGAPLAGATVSAGGAFTATTDLNGDYLLDDIPAGLAVLTASKPGYLSETDSVDLLSGGTSTLDFQLAPGVGPGEAVRLQDIFNAGVNLGWAQIHGLWRYHGDPPILHPPDGPTTETEIIADLNRLKAHLEASGYPFSDYEGAVDGMMASLQRNEDSLFVPTGCARLMTQLQTQMGDAACLLEAGDLIEIQQIFNAGVNLGWAQIHSLWRYHGEPPILHPPDGPTTETEIIADLKRLGDHLMVSGFPFSGYEEAIDGMIGSLQANEDSLYVPTECAQLLFELQDQLGDITCQGEGSGMGNLLVVTSRARLEAKFGQVGYAQIADGLEALNATILDVSTDDDTVIDGEIEAMGQEGIDAILIIGGHDIVPFSEMVNPKKDQDMLLLSDDLYADFDHDANQVIDVPIARIPDGGDLDLVLTQLSPPVAAESGAFTLANKNRLFAEDIAQLIGASPRWSAPTQAFDISAGELQVPVLYFMLHGSGNSGTKWYGELGTPADWTAIEAFHAAGARSQGVVLSGACYGAKIANYTPAESICLAFLKSGAKAFVGATAITYSHLKDGANQLGGLFHRLFFENLASGDSPLQAYFDAKRSFGSSAVTPVEKKISHIFVFYGRP
jgi:hypothetical protein